MKIVTIEIEQQDRELAIELWKISRDAPLYENGVACGNKIAIEQSEAIDYVRESFGVEGVAAVVVFLRALPSDATINWGEGQWTPVAVFAEQVNDAL